MLENKFWSDFANNKNCLKKLEQISLSDYF